MSAAIEPPIYVETFATRELRPEGGVEDEVKLQQVHTVAVASDAVWADGVPPDINPLNEDGLNGETSGVVTLVKNALLTRIGVSRRFTVSDPAQLRASIPQRWGDGTTYEYILRDGDGVRRDVPMLGWSVLRERGDVTIRSVNLLSGPFPYTLTYYAYAGSTVADLLGRPGTLITQNAHGFAAGEAVRVDGGGWSKALATAEGETLSTHVVSTVIDPNTFTVLTSGGMALVGHGLGAVGAELYLSDATPGLLVTVAPGAVMVQRVARVSTVDSLDVFPATAVQSVPRSYSFSPEYPSSSTAADQGGSLFMSGITGLQRYYRWESNGPAREMKITKHFMVPKGAYMLAAGGVALVAHTTTGGDCLITLDVYNDADVPLAASVTGSSANVEFTLAATVPTVFEPGARGHVTVTASARDGEIASAGLLTLTWLTRDP